MLPAKILRSIGLKLDGVNTPPWKQRRAKMKLRKKVKTVRWSLTLPQQDKERPWLTMSGQVLSSPLAAFSMYQFKHVSITSFINTFKSVTKAYLAWHVVISLWPYQPSTASGGKVSSYSVRPRPPSFSPPPPPSSSGSSRLHPTGGNSEHSKIPPYVQVLPRCSGFQVAQTRTNTSATQGMNKTRYQTIFL